MKEKTKNFLHYSLIGFLIILISCFYILKTKAVETYTAATARLILRISLELEKTDLDYDLDSDGEITANDARIALRRAVGLSDEEEIIELLETTTIEETTIEETQYYQIGVLSTCGLKEAQLINGLFHELRQYAWAFLEAERQYNVNAVFLAAVAAHESGWGQSYLARNNNNFFGWKGSSGFMYFNSAYECIMHVAKSLRYKYLTPGGGCFNGYDVEDIAICYCPGGGWSSHVYDLMAMIKRNAT